MRAFLINLDRDTGRYTAAKDQLDKLGVSFERFPAILGRSLTSEEISAKVSTFRSLMTHGMKWTLAQCGCTLSHLSVYKKMIDDGIDCAVIFEDDIFLSPEFCKGLKKVESVLDKNKSQVFLFSDHSNDRNDRLALSTDQVRVIPIAGDLCAEAYAITLPAAKELYRINFPMAVPVDYWKRFCARGHIELFRVEPALARQNKETFDSNIDMREISRNLLFKCGWKAWRCIGTIVDYVYFLLFRK